MVRRWVPPAICVVAILAISSVPRLGPPVGWTGADKAAHVLEYGILGFLLARAAGTGSAGLRLLILLLGGAVGACDEIRQSMVPGRVPSWVDWGADLLGCGMGAAVAAALDLRRARPSRAACEGEGRK